MIQEDESRSDLPPPTDPMPVASTPGVKVYERPTRSLPPAWLLGLLALLVLAGLWFAFAYVF